MKMGFVDTALQRLCESGAALAARFGDEIPKVVQAQLADLRALPCLGDLRKTAWSLQEVDDTIHLALPKGHAMRVAGGTGTAAGQTDDWHAAQTVTILGIGPR